MSFQHTIKIPKERIGALIGKGGRVKQRIEKRCGVKIEIDSETGDTMIMDNKSADHLEAFRAVEAITAISICVTTRASLQMHLSASKGE